MPNYLHSGSLGDIVYSLPCLLALEELQGKCNLFLRPGIRAEYYEGAYHPSGNVRMTHGGAASLMPLLQRQGIEVSIWKDEKIDLELDRFRDMGLDLRMGHIARWYFHAINVNRDLSLPWLAVDAKRNGAVVINRSFRYRNPDISYAFLTAYKPLFVGMEEEFVSCKREIPGLEWIETRDCLELAEVIAGSSVFIGNQSLPFAIAEGLKVPRVLEVCRWCPNVIPHGANGWDFLAQRLFEGIVDRLFRKPGVLEEYQDEG